MNVVSDTAIFSELARLERELAHLRIVAHMRSNIPLPERCTRMARLIDTAATNFSMSASAIMGQDQSKRVCRARSAVMWAGRHAFSLSLPMIGRALGNRDHTTVMSGIRRAEALRAEDAEFRAITEELIELFTPRYPEEAENARRSH